MVHYEDLSPCDELPGFACRAIGWLEPEHDYPKGPVPENFLAALTRLLSFHWAPYTAGGVHECGLCQSNPIEEKDELIVPGENGLFFAPTMILHYIQNHHYQPPMEFQQAVLACPPTDSEAYFDDLEASGLIAFWEQVCGPNLRAQHRQASQTKRFEEPQ